MLHVGFPSFSFLIQSLYYVETADTGILLQTYLQFLQLASALNNSQCKCACVEIHAIPNHLYIGT